VVERLNILPKVANALLAKSKVFAPKKFIKKKTKNGKILPMVIFIIFYYLGGKSDSLD